MDVQKLYETLTGEPHPEAERRTAMDSVREALPQESWPLGKRLLWFAAYLAVFALLAFMILPRR